jgi:outer membrane lipoprotein-sorting protein
MDLPRLILVTALALVAAVGCTWIGAPERASDTQNLNAISDDISALTMTQSDVMHAADPMSTTVLPRHYQLSPE